METVRLTSEHTASLATHAAVHLSAGGVVLVPTDTLYGLAADAFANEAVDNIYRIKGRDEGKPVHALVRDIDMAARFCEITDAARALIEQLPRGKVTFICTKKLGLETGICRGIDTFGFRIPDHAFDLALVDAFGGPVTATSANIAGMQPQRTVDAILAQLGGNADMLSLAVDAGELPPSPPSSVLDLTGDPPRLLREGALARAQIPVALA